MTEQPQTDHDLLIRMDEKLNGIKTDFSGIKDDVTKLETRVTLQEKHSERQDGAIAITRWFIGVYLTILSLAIAALTIWKG